MEWIDELFAFGQAIPNIPLEHFYGLYDWYYEPIKEGYYGA